MKLTGKRFFALIIVCLCFAASCRKMHNLNSLMFPSTPEISTAGRFALVTDPYISMRDQPGDNGITIAHARRGEIYPVDGTRIVSAGKNIKVIWMNLGSGWVPEPSIQLYSSAEKAETAAQLLP